MREKADVDRGKHADVPTNVADEVKALQREVRELHRTPPLWAALHDVGKVPSLSAL